MTLDAQALGSLFEISRDPVVGIEHDIIVFANPAARSLLGAQTDQPTGSLFPKNLLPQLAESCVTAAYLKGRSGTLSVQHCGSLAIATFVPQQTEYDGTIVNKRTLQEIGNSLFTLRMAADGVIKGIPTEDDIKLNTYASVLYRSYYQLKRLYQHMTTLDALSDGSLPESKRVLDVEQLYGELCRTVAFLIQDKGISLRFEAEEGPFYLTADSDHLEMLLLNLLANSLTHSASGDTITVKLRHMSDRLLLTVDDQGTGIPPDILSGLFSRSYTPAMKDTKVGAGLGLAVVRGIADHYGGTLVLESLEEHGTSIRVTLSDDRSTQLSIHAPHTEYREDGMDNILTELAVYFDRELYTRKMFD